METSRRRFRVWTALMVAGLLFAVAACTGGTDGVPQEDYDAVQADLEQAEADLAAAQTQVVSGGTTSQQVVQLGELAAPIEPVAIGADGWTNEESVRGGLHLIAELDSSGEDAWNIEEHPRVYFTSESYQTNNYPRGDEGQAKLDDLGLGNFIGWHVVDAYSKEVIASALYEYNGTNLTEVPLPGNLRVAGGPIGASAMSVYNDKLYTLLEAGSSRIYGQLYEYPLLTNSSHSSYKV